MEPSPPETRSETPLIVPEKSATPHLEIEHPQQDQDTLSSDSTNSFRVQLRRVNEHLDEVQKEVIKSKEEAAESSKHKSPFALEIRDKPVPPNFRLLVLESNDGSLDLTEHVFLTTLRGLARMWYDRLQSTTIISFDQLARELEQTFLPNARPKPTAASLLGIVQGREEPLTQFVNRFATESRAIPDAHPSLVVQVFLMGMRPSKLFWSLVEKPPTTVPEMM
ncbi:hypothetical protein B296_00044643 [Ensete ventricosum]|uniref:Retrotransposon gag domain-containing protein n=1 Tax=Ensete ventricosum TaxID=4639 RepID=A0A426YN91_ENSVE|nr:hypothetical protein B296_00044643 [Ensete ventricosum]